MARHSNPDCDDKAPAVDRWLTRRVFGGVALGSLSSVAVALQGVANAETVSTTAEPDGPDHLPRRRVKVLDTEISYVDTGSGEPVVFLHGNPTWSYQWRNIIPYLSANRRCLAPDFVGMGWSGKSPDKAYRFVDQARYMDAWFEALQLTKNVTCVGHDWGGPIAFYRARRYPGQIKAIAYYETIILPRRWEDYTGDRARRFQQFRSPEGERLVLDENMFLETSLPGGIIRKLSDEEMEAYHAPYRDRERRLTITSKQNVARVERPEEDFAGKPSYTAALPARCSIPISLPRSSGRNLRRKRSGTTSIAKTSPSRALKRLPTRKRSADQWIDTSRTRAERWSCG